MILSEQVDLPTTERSVLNGWFLTLILLSSQLLVLFLSEYILLDDSLYFEFFGDKLSYEQIEDIIKQGSKWKWVSYALAPVVTLLKCSCIALFLYSGAFFLRKEISLSSFFRISVLAEFIALLPMIVKIIWFGFFHRIYTLEELSNFSPLSVLAFSDINSMDAWFAYPLHLLNLFEVAYWFALAILLREFFDESFWWRLRFVSCTYGVMLSIWVLLIMFLIISLT